MPFKGSPTVVIQPCYDGLVLPKIQQVAGDGLALLSIKEAHGDCTLIREPGSKLPTLSCNQGIKPRNSFWNLHKPDLRKVRGLECTTSDRVIELFQAHNIESSSAKSYKKKVISKLGSIISKKSKTPTQPQVLVQNVSWPINCCVLSSVCQETELVTPNILRNEETEKTIKKHDFETSTLNFVENEVKDAVFITLPSSNMHENTSDDFIPVSELLDPSNGDSSTKTTPPFNPGNSGIRFGYNGSCEVAISQQVMSSSILLESKQSQHQISIPSNVEFYTENSLKSCVIANDMLTTDEKLKRNKFDIFDSFNLQDDGTENPSSIVQAIFSDIFQDIEEIKDVINSYMSSFYVQEEEYNNFPALHMSSKEVASHFVQQLHGPLKDTNCNPKNMHSTIGHSFSENGHDCCPEQSSIVNVVDTSVSHTVDMKAEDEDSLQMTTAGIVNKSGNEKETSSYYCYWDDSDLAGELPIDRLSGKTEDGSIPERDKALVPLEFIERMWEEFTIQVETHAIFIDLVNGNRINKFESHERNFPSYGHWASMYDPSIFQEAENIVYTLDSLLMNGCFPTDEGNNAAYIPCTIVEVVDEREFAPGFEEGPIDNGDKPGNADENIFTEQENQAIPHKNENQNCMLNESISTEMIKRKDNHEIKLKPVFYQEKETIQEIDCSRVPQYEKIQLDPIDHKGRVNFSTIQSYSSKSDSPLAAENIKHVTEEQIYKIIQKGDQSPKYFYRENCVDSKIQPTQEENHEKKIDKEDSDTQLPMFDRIQEKNSEGNSNSAFLFSSPTVQLNLTNPYVNTSRK